jgi:hypothetical protein
MKAAVADLLHQYNTGVLDFLSQGMKPGSIILNPYPCSRQWNGMM